MIQKIPAVALLGVLIGLQGCASSKHAVPVAERSTGVKSPAVARAAFNSPQREKDWRPRIYIVQKGDTLFSIAFNYGFDYRELAEINSIADPSVIKIGQEIRLFRDANALRPVIIPAQPPAPAIKEGPKAVKYAYSESAVTELEKGTPLKEAAAKPAPAPVAKTPPVQKAEPAPQPPEQTAVVADEEGLTWRMPSDGKLISSFSEADNRKGVDIAGTLGQPVYASAGGKVVYSGSGLRGYGKLVIIKHNPTYLSAYAHNSKILVKEGQSVQQGQKIAEMGNTDSDQVKLHFEVRRYGKPVDPARYLSLGKS
jgi:lipoprotein NlpD